MTGKELSWEHYLASAVRHSTLNSDELSAVMTVLRSVMSAPKKLPPFVERVVVESSEAWDFLSTAVNASVSGVELLDASEGPVTWSDLSREFYLPPGAALELDWRIVEERAEAEHEHDQMMRDQEWDYRHA